MWIRRTLKWTGAVVLGLLGLALIAVLSIHIAMGRDLRMTYAVQGDDIVVPVDAASIEEGQRQAQLRGCAGGCHGPAAEGQVMIRLFDGTRVVAPDLGLYARRHSTSELERVIRHGIKPDDTGVIRLMPSEMLSKLNDHDLGLIIAWLRSQPESEADLPSARYGPVARVLGFQLKRQIGTLIAPDVIDHVHMPPHDPSDVTAHGRYLADTVCSECHGNDLRGAPDGSTPSLVMTMIYSLEDFADLMREGTPVGGRELGLMADVSRSRFSRFSDQEILALHTYLGSEEAWVE